MSNVLITGASGFIGRSLIRLLADEHAVTAMTRTPASFSENVAHAIATLDDRAGLATALEGQDVVIHAAGKAHGPISAEEYHATNLQGTATLLEESARQNVGRFIFLSSISVYGKTHSETMLSESSSLEPITLYGKSKLAAEHAVQELSQELGVEYVTIRPPAVYGDVAPGSFRRLIKLVGARLPLPLANATNKRSYVSIANLSDFVRLCITHPASKNTTFHVSDDADISTADLIVELSRAFGHKPLLVPIPSMVMELGAKLVGQPDLYRQLFGRLQLDISKAKSELGWRPPQSLMNGLLLATAPFRLPAED